MATIVNASGTANGTVTPLTATTAGAAATAVMAVINSANSTLTTTAQSAALGILSVVASAPINVSGSAGAAVVSALSSIAGSASANNLGALAQVSSVLDSLASSAASSLLSSAASGTVSITFNTTQIQASTSVTPPGVVSTAPISAPGSASSFDAPPPGLLSSAIGFNSTAPLVTQFRSLAFDPYSSANASAAGSLSTVGGVTRLAFSTAYGPLVIADATTPITFTLPAVNTTGAVSQLAVCAFYDIAAGAYSMTGCIGLPNPAPPGHSLGFIPGYMTPSDAYLAGAWSITGPLVDGNCQQQLIDCASTAPCSGVVWGRNCSVVPNQRVPLGAANAAISCPATGSPVLRVMYGGLCALWQNNTLGCWWNNTNQSFTGPGCVSSAGPTRCMCRHLTDFAAARAPSLSSVSVSELAGLSPGDIITKLRLLFIVVIALFGVMLLGAALGFVQDWHYRKRLLAKLMDARYGFSAQKDGTWTWALRQEPLAETVGAPSGTAVKITEVFAIPFIRLRSALPEELLPGSLAQALGRRTGLSTRGLTDTKADHDTVFTALRRRRPVAVDQAAPAQKASLSWDDASDSLVGTALVFAFLASHRVLPVGELAARRASAAAFFAGRKVAGIAHDFTELCSLFSLMLGFDNGSMASSVKWLDNARLWRLILLQQPDGGWDLSDSLAFVTLAHDGHLPKGDTVAECLARCAARADLEDTELASDVASNGDDMMKAAGDCPLTFSPQQLRHRMPSALLNLPGGERLWATALACGVLAGLTRSWLLEEEAGEEKTILDAGKAYIDACCLSDAAVTAFVASGELGRCVERTLRRWRTVHDGVVGEARSHEVLARQWLFTHQQRAASMVLKSCVTDHDTLATFLDAEGYLQRWQAFSILMTLVVSSLLVSIWFYSSRGTACCAEIRGLLDSGAGGNCSQQSPSAPLPGPSSALLLDAGLGSSCLAGTPTGPCLGYTGNCGDLQTQFATLPGAYVYSPTVQCSSTPGDPSCFCRPTLQDNVCHAFPDDAYVSDQVLVGLISVAIALPSRMVLEQAFLATVQTDAAEGWLVYAGLPRLLMGWRAHKRWRWATQRPSDLIVWLTTVYPEAVPWDFVAFLGWWVPKQLLPNSLYGALEQRFGGRSWSAGWVGVALLLCGPFGWLALLIVAVTYRRQRAHTRSVSHEAAEEEEPHGVCADPAAQSRIFGSLGMLAVLAAWAIYAWFIFVFGMQIYTRLGADAERKFAQTWGIGYGLDQAQQWRSIAQTAVKAALVVIVLDLLRIKSHSSWLEDVADFASVQCMLFDGKQRSWWQQTKELMARQYRTFEG